jgi:hypothetical protein
MKLHISDDVKFTRDIVTQTLIVYGGKGMGKTNLGTVLCEEFWRARIRFSYIDPMGVMYGIRHAGKSPGIPVLILGGVHGDIPIEPTAGAVVADLVVDEDVSVIIDISRFPTGKMWSVGQRIRFVTDYVKRLYERQGEKMRPMMQFIDEASRYCPQIIPHGRPDLAECVGAIEAFAEEGRNIGLGLTLLAQRSARLNKSVAELADCMIAFRIVGPNSIKAIVEWFGEHIPKERWSELIETLRKLPRGSALVVSPGWLEFEGVARIRHRETFDTSGTPKSGRRRQAHGKGATVDLSKYLERMAATIERAKTEDPKALRTEIAKLKAELAKKPAPVSAPPEKAKKEFVLDRTAVGALGKAVDRCIALRPSLAKLDQRMEVIGQQCTNLFAAVVAAQDKMITAAKPAELRAFEFAEPIKRGSIPAPKITQGPNLKLGQRRILNVLKQLSDRRLSRSEISTLSGTPLGTLPSYMSGLRSNGMIDETESGVTITNAGQHESHVDTPLGITDVVARWTLKAGQKRILDFVLQSVGSSRQAVSETLGIPMGTMPSYLSGLRRAGLIEENGKGLMPGHALFMGGGR